MSRPRIRSIHPDWCVDEALSDVSDRAERLWWRLHPFCDDAGRVADKPRVIAGQAGPLLGWDAQLVDALLDELAGVGLVERYQAGGQRVVQVARWAEYQRPNRPSPSRLPPPPETHGQVSEESVTCHGGVTDSSNVRGSGASGAFDTSLTPPSGEEGRGEERRGEECVPDFAPISADARHDVSDGDTPPEPFRLIAENDAATDARWDEFWAAYPTRNGSKGSKRSARTQWAALTAAQRLQALAHVAPFARWCRGEVTGSESLPPDAERWLRRKAWTDDEMAAAWTSGRGVETVGTARPERRVVTEADAPVLTRADLEAAAAAARQRRARTDTAGVGDGDN